MSYEDALRKAGATVHYFEQCGSYRGDWYAKVTYEGKTGWVQGSYGSCPGCDAFESEFGWGDPTDEALAKFGREYLDKILTQEEALADASKNASWDVDADAAVAFIKKNAIVDTHDRAPSHAELLNTSLVAGRYILDSAGEPVIEPDLLKWAEWMNVPKNRVLKQETLPSGVFVSTVFLAL